MPSHSTADEFVTSSVTTWYQHYLSKPEGSDTDNARWDLEEQIRYAVGLVGAVVGTYKRWRDRVEGDVKAYSLATERMYREKMGWLADGVARLEDRVQRVQAASGHRVCHGEELYIARTSLRVWLDRPEWVPVQPMSSMLSPPPLNAAQLAYFAANAGRG